MDDVRRLYLSILQREPDPDGLIIYSRILKETNIQRVEDILKSSEEFKALQSCVPIDDARLVHPVFADDPPQPPRVHQLVVARYHETTEWIPSDAIVYNKGEPIEHPRFKVIDAYNEGREGETYLRHIIENYDTLAEFTLFTQADPFDHNPLFVQDVHANEGETFRSFGKWWQPGIPPESVIRGSIRPNIHIGNRDFVCTHPELWEDDGWVRIVRRVKMRHHIKYILHWVCERLHLEEPTAGVPISMCGMFSVHRSRIHMYPISFYENMKLFLLEHPDHGYIIERFWAILFLLGCAYTGEQREPGERAP